MRDSDESKPASAASRQTNQPNPAEQHPRVAHDADGPARPDEGKGRVIDDAVVCRFIRRRLGLQVVVELRVFALGQANGLAVVIKTPNGCAGSEGFARQGKRLVRPG